MKRNLFFLIFLISLLLCFGVSAQNSYEVYNYGEFTGITDVIMSESEKEYIQIKDLPKLNMEYEYLLEGGFRITDGKTTAEIYYNKDLEINKYSFANPLITVNGDMDYLLLDIIGKCFSNDYRGSLRDDTWKIYLEVGDGISSVPEPMPYVKGLEIDGILYDYVNNLYIVRIKCENNCQYNDVQIFLGLYDSNNRLIDACLKNRYIVERTETEFTVVIPLKESVAKADSVKLMMWSDGGFPQMKSFTIKDLEFDRTMSVPIEKEQIFSDVGTDDRYYDAIYIMNKQFGEDIIFAGYDDGTFKGEEKITRAMYAYAISKLLGMNFSKVFIEAEYPFRDMPKSEWCYREAGFAVANGFMYCENDEFLPDKNVTSNEVLFGFLAALGENVSHGDKVAKLAFERNLLENVNLEDILGSKVSKKAFIQIAYNFMMEYTKNGVIL